MYELADLFGARRSVETVSGTNRRPAFTLPSNVDKNDFWIGYHFQGREPDKDVEVYGRPWWFLSDDNGDGLIWPFKTPAPALSPASTCAPGAPAPTSSRPPTPTVIAPSISSDSGMNVGQNIDDRGIFGIVSAALHPGTFVASLTLPYLRTSLTQ